MIFRKSSRCSRYPPQFLERSSRERRSFSTFESGRNERTDRSFLPLSIATRPRAELSVAFSHARSRKMEAASASSTPAIFHDMTIPMRCEPLAICEEKILHSEIVLIAVSEDHALAFPETSSDLLFDSHPVIRHITPLDQFRRTIPLVRFAHPISPRGPHEIRALQIMLSSFHSCLF